MPKPCLDCGKLGNQSRCSGCRKQKAQSSHYSTQAHRRWADQVKRDAYGMCRICGSSDRVTAHHKKNRAAFPHLALDPTNGVALCASHHSLYEADRRARRVTPLTRKIDQL